VFFIALHYEAAQQKTPPQLRTVAGAKRCGLPVVHLDVCQPGAGFAKALEMLAAL
jgi:hypothetical protein